MKPKLLEQIEARLFYTEDLIVRDFDLYGKQAKLVYIETLCDADKLENSLFKQWFHRKSEDYDNLAVSDLITSASVFSYKDPEEAVKALLDGNALVHCEGAWYSLNAEQANVRSIQEPDNESSIIGERSGFIEQLNVNINLIRNRSSSPQLKVRYLTIGKYSTHKIAVLWQDGVADSRIVKEVTQRLMGFNTGMEVHPGRLQKELLKEEKRTLFPQVFGTERIDTATNLIMQGRIAILCEQSSTCLIVPVSFYTFLRSIDSMLMEDKAALVLQTLRAIGLLLSLYICSLYIAVVSFHHEVLPSQMAITIKGSLENVPYSPIIEAVLMIVIFQLIAETTIRLPSQIAQMVGVAGGIIISEALVKIGFVSNVYIVIVALSVIGSFLIPTYQMRVLTLILQLMFVFAAWIVGFYGMTLLTAACMIHFFSLEPFGVPYYSPIRSRAK
ncbi:spore germination protein [Paenibacillus sp. JDR-2]|uniref:spore germination protein n=1 Tax=Paenibacillus sp. (strain JDR-2) TaxID=324057 RepID=UPI0001666746|nr:spore germination protein [Paenibacillus sp. JDR-2]ACT02191.1 GerA spore germination protein [Paenibacillus sp. JDR-2]